MAKYWNPQKFSWIIIKVENTSLIKSPYDMKRYVYFHYIREDTSTEAQVGALLAQGLK